MQSITLFIVDYNTLDGLCHLAKKISTTFSNVTYHIMETQRQEEANTCIDIKR